MFYSTSAWKMKALCLIIVLTGSFSHWAVSERSISLFSILFLNVIVGRADVSDKLWTSGRWKTRAQPEAPADNILRGSWTPCTGWTRDDTVPSFRILIPNLGDWKMKLRAPECTWTRQKEITLMVQLHKTQIIFVVLTLHHFMDKQESRIWHNKHNICVAAWL